MVQALSAAAGACDRIARRREGGDNRSRDPSKTRSQMASNSIAIRWTKGLKACFGLVNVLFALFGLRMVRVSRLRALHREREALKGQLKSAHRVQEALTGDLYSLRAKTDAPQMPDDRSKRVSIMIPTINSEPYIGLILRYYYDLRVNIHVLVDSKTNDKTFEIAQNYASVEIMENKTGVIEDSLEEISKKMGTDWVLRIDDDELPSKAMLDFVYEVIHQEEIEVVGFRRYQCAVSKPGFVLFSQEYDSDKQRQWRLYRPLKVDFIKKIHSPGFRRNSQRSLKAPDDAFMIHLDWAIHSYAERLLKLERYERRTPGSGNNWRPYYLYEENAAHRFDRLAAPEFDGLAKEISERFSDLCV